MDTVIVGRFRERGVLWLLICREKGEKLMNSLSEVKNYLNAGIVICLDSKMFNSAIIYTKELEKYESLDEAEFEKIHALYDAHAISVIILCVSALEAKINQFYDLNCGQNGANKSFKEARCPISKKYNEALRLLNKEDFKYPKKSDYDGDTTRYITDLQKYELYKSVIHLFDLRNAIVHYNLEIHYRRHERVSMQMYHTLFDKGVLTKRNKPINRDIPYFPNQCLGFGSAKWAVKTTFLFWEEYFKRTDNDREIRHYRMIKPNVAIWL